MRLSEYINVPRSLGKLARILQPHEAGSSHVELRAERRVPQRDMSPRRLLKDGPDVRDAPG